MIQSLCVLDHSQQYSSHRGKYTVVDIQRQIQQWIYNTEDKVVDIQ